MRWCGRGCFQYTSPGDRQRLFLTSPSRSKTLGLLVFCSVAVLWVWRISGPVAMDYFFLSDDFHLIGGAMENSLVSLMTEPHFGYFRPLVHLSVALQTVFFGWEIPGGYAWVSICLHVFNAGLLIALFGAIGFQLAVAIGAGCLFLLAPWAYETTAWVSCQFDLTATSLYLLSLLCGVHAYGPKAGRRSWLWATWTLFFVALCAKEIAVTLPFALFFLLRAQDKPTASSAQEPATHPKGATRGGWKWVLGILLLYFTLRFAAMASSGIFDPLGGAQGNFFVALFKTNPAANLWSYLESLVSTPHPSRTSGAFRGIHLGYVSVMGILALASLWSRPKKALMGVGLVLISLLPVLWQFRMAGHPLGGRLMYVANIWVVFILALGLEGFVTYRPSGVGWPGPLAALLMGSIFLLHGFSSELHQATLWRQSSSVARHGVEDFKPYLGHPAPIHIENLPFILRNGPFCLKDYAFRYYYGSETTPDVTAQHRTLFQRGGKLVMLRLQGRPSDTRPLNAKSITLPRVP